VSVLAGRQRRTAAHAARHGISAAAAHAP
jgi:hypothetical protein